MPTKQPVTASANASGSTSNLSGGAIAGIVIGVLAAVAIAVGAYMYMKKKGSTATAVNKFEEMPDDEAEEIYDDDKL